MTEVQNQTQGSDRPEKKAKADAKLEYKLVVWMLWALCGLVGLLILIPLIKPGSGELIDFSKWVLTALLAAFGAWIGAGAAYFFGKQNLELSSKSTQDAINAQLGVSRKDARIKQLDLSLLDPNFQIDLNKDTIKEISAKIDEYSKYWFIPIVQDKKVVDVLRTEAVWRYKLKRLEGVAAEKVKETLEKIGNEKISKVIDFLDADEKLKKAGLHEFMIFVELEDPIDRVSQKMKAENASVGIVSDQSGRPTHCFSSKDLRSFLLGEN